MNKRKAGIELMRFLAAALIVMTHVRRSVYPDSGLAELGPIAVEFFFMLTGFFAMRTASSDGPSGTVPAAHDAVLFSWRRARNIYGLYFFALALMFVIRTAQKETFVLTDALQELFHFKWEFLMLQTAGFIHAPAYNTDYLLSSGWFVSSLVIALAPFYFLGRRFRKTFSGVVAPLCAAAVYAYSIQSFSTMDVGNQYVFGTMLANYRAFAGLCAGAFVFHLSGRLSAAPDKGKAGSFLRVMDVLSWVMAVSLFVLPKRIVPEADALFWLIPFAVILLNGVSDAGPVSRLLNHHGAACWTLLGELSLYVYLLHMQVITVCKGPMAGLPSGWGSLLILAAVIVFSSAVLAVRKKISPAQRG